MKEINREHFEHWLFSQPLSRKFYYAATTECVICNFVRDTSCYFASAGGYDFSLYPTQERATRHLEPIITKQPIPTWLFVLLQSAWKYEKDGTVLYVRDLQREYVKVFPDTLVPSTTLSDEPAEKPAIVSVPQGQTQPLLVTGSQLALPDC